MATVELQQIVKRYRDTLVVHGIDLAVKDREFVALVGPSGCGKSTTLRMVAGLEEISAGEMRIAGRRVNDLPPRERNISMVFQSYALYPHMTVAENMGFALKIAKTAPAEVEARVAEAARILALEPYLNRRPSELSGGQRQRVAMGRAIVRKPDVFLFDEPLSNLDAKLRTQMRTEIKKLHQRLQSTAIYVTHDQVEAMTLADRIVIMRDGRIEQIGTPDAVFNHPATRFVAGFIGSPPMNMAEAVVDGGGLRLADGQRLALPERYRAEVAAGEALTIGLRPDDVFPSGHGLGAGDPVELTLPITLTEPLGNETMVFFGFGGAEWVARMLDPRDLRPGQPVAMTFDLARLHLFRADGTAIAPAGR